MIRKVDYIKLFKRRGLLGSQWMLKYKAKTAKLDRKTSSGYTIDDVVKMSEEDVCEFGLGGDLSGGGYYLYKGMFYKDTEGLDIEDAANLIRDRIRRKERKLQALRDREKNPNRREPIPDDVQIFVWRRDGGKCVKCGSNQNLEYDHIIPVSKGGANTERNIQLLCQTCNRSKGASIG